LYTFWGVEQKRKIPKKRKTVDPKYSKGGLLMLIKKVYIDFPLRLVNDRLSLEPDSFNFYGVHIFEGCQGSGKTMSAMHLLKQLKEKYPLVKIRSNININFQDGEINGWQDLIKSDNGIFGQIEYIDEMQNWFDCMESKDFPPEMLAEVTQQLKQRKCIIGTSQVFDRLSKPIREQITMLYKPLTIAGAFTIVRVYDVRIDNGGQVDKMKMRRLYCFVHDDELRNCYDTYKKVERISAKGFQSRANQLSNIQDVNNNIIVTDKRQLKKKV
jgi:ATP-dependent Clp protease ATP-binding subunit ClpX